MSNEAFVTTVSFLLVLSGLITTGLMFLRNIVRKMAIASDTITLIIFNIKLIK